MSSSNTRSTWRFLSRTPIWDMLRRTEPYRMDWAGTIEESSLPEPLKQFVHDLVRGCWLWATEKRDIALELIAHFADGLDAGHSADELIKDFGDPRQARQLFTRAKRRQRPWIQKFFWRANQAALWLMLIVAVLIGIQVVRVRTRSAVIDTNYWEQMQASVANVPADQAAWPLYHAAILAGTPEPATVRNISFNRINIAEAMHDPNVSLWLQHNAEFIRLGLAATQRPALGTVLVCEQDPNIVKAVYSSATQSSDELVTNLSENPPLYSGMLATVAGLRNLCDAFRLAAAEAAGQADPQRFMTYFNAQMRLIDHLTTGGVTSIEQALALTRYQTAVEELGYVLHVQPDLLSNENLIKIAHQLSGQELPAAIEPCLQFEIIAFRDLVQRLYSPGPHGRPTPEFVRDFINWTSDGRPRPLEKYQYIFVSNTLVFGDLMAATAPSRGELENSLKTWRRQTLALAAAPFWERSPLAIHTDNEHALKRADLFEAIQPAVARLIPRRDKAALKRDALLVAVALELHHRQNGAFPARLAELVPQSLPAIPIDLFNNAPIHYRLTPEGPMLYSVGVDGDDDAGRPVAQNNGDKDPAADWSTWGAAQWRATHPKAVEKMKPIPNGDWILWPPRNP